MGSKDLLDMRRIGTEEASRGTRCREGIHEEMKRLGSLEDDEDEAHVAAMCYRRRFSVYTATSLF